MQMFTRLSHRWHLEGRFTIVREKSVIVWGVFAEARVSIEVSHHRRTTDRMLCSSIDFRWKILWFPWQEEACFSRWENPPVSTISLLWSSELYSRLIRQDSPRRIDSGRSWHDCKHPVTDMTYEEMVVLGETVYGLSSCLRWSRHGKVRLTVAVTTRRVSGDSARARNIGPKVSGMKMRFSMSSWSSHIHTGIWWRPHWRACRLTGWWESKQS
jgi:hypothetical protein